MKHVLTNLFIAVLFITSCNKETVLTIEDEQQAIMDELSSNPWKAIAVERDDVDVTSEYQNFELTITSQNKYSTRHGGLSWPATGTLTFDDQSKDILKRDDGISVNLKLESDPDKTLHLSFQMEHSSYSNGKTTSLKGDYHFTLVPNHLQASHRFPCQDKICFAF